MYKCNAFREKFTAKMLQCKVLVIVTVILVLQIHQACMLDNNHSRYYLVALKDGNMQDAMILAKENHCKVVKQIRGFDNVFLLERLPSYSTNSKRSQVMSEENLNTDDRVLWASKQRPIQREKRDLIYYPYEDYYGDILTNRLETIRGRLPFNDELWDEQWYLQNSRNKTNQRKLDLNVLPVYAKGITGKGVRVSVLDDGLEFNHDDLFDNYDPEISWDCTADYPDPRPDYSDLLNRHGTRCAGEIAMIANNKKCGVGIAYNVRIGGIKLLGDLLFDFIEGTALGFAMDKVDIYSSSWGPTDNGFAVEGPGPFASLAIKRGATEGRGGKGCIYVWASGNGGSKNDSCNCDGYTASIYTITVGSATQRGTLPWYSERCASILTVTYSSGTMSDKMVTTTDLRNKCTVQHTGTSASAPLAAGIIALGLEANPDLTWRDVQHIIVRTSDPNSLDSDGWVTNGGGRRYNHKFGFGLMNADAFVTLAMKWRTVPAKLTEQFKGNDTADTNSSSSSTRILFDASATRIRYLEHVQIKVNVVNSIRGKLEMYIKSPFGVRIPILEQRKYDNSTMGFKDWVFMSVATWSENPKGLWVLEIIDNSIKGDYLSVGECTLILHGTILDPDAIVVVEQTDDEDNEVVSTRDDVREYDDGNLLEDT